MELYNQVGLFVLTVATGLGLALLFDVYRAIRRKLRFRTVLTFIGDFIYWILATSIVFGMLLAGNGGELRLYVFMGLLSGAVIYYQILSRYVMRSLMKLLHIAAICCKYLFSLWQGIILKPVRWLLMVMHVPVRAIAAGFNSIKNKISK